MQIIVNSDPYELPAEATVADLLERLDVSRKGTAVEVNRQLVPRSQHADRALAEGDRVEIVTLVGGG